MKFTRLFAIAVLSACTAAPAFAAPVPSSSRCAVVPDTATISAAVAVEALPALPAVPAHSSIPFERIVTWISLFGVLGVVKTTPADKDSYFTSQTSRLQLNKAIADMYYFFNTRPAWQVAAAAVAPPVCNTGTTTSKVKTTATTQMMLAGVLKSLTATDDLWTLTGADRAAGSVRRYLLLWDGASATTVVSVLASDDRVIASYTNAAAALAACRFPSLPPLGTGIVGILSITNVTNAFVPGTTLLGAAGVTAAYIDGPDDSILQSAQVTP